MIAFESMRAALRRFCRVFAAFVMALATSTAAGTESVSPSEYDMELVAQTLPATIDSDSEVEVPLVLRNLGSTPWSSGDGFHVSYHWLSRNGEVIEWDGLRTQIPSETTGGGELRVDAKLRTPRIGGVYLLQWDVVQENVCWISELDPTPAQPLEVTIRELPATHALSIIEQSTGSWMWTHQTQIVDLLIRNDGTQPWHPDLPINVSYRWRDAKGAPIPLDPRRTGITKSVEPGETARVSVALDTPTRSGDYTLQWDMVHEGVCWFSDRDATPEPEIPISVLPTPDANWHGAFFFTLACLTLVLIPTLRSGSPAWLVHVGSYADLVWFLPTLMLKQGVILKEASQSPKPGSVWIVLMGLCVVPLALLPVRRTIRPWITWLVDTAVSLLILADLVHQRYFGDLISMVSSGSAGQLADVTASIRALLSARDAWLVIDLVPGLAIAFLASRLGRTVTGRVRRYLALALCALAVPGVVRLSQILSVPENLFGYVFKNTFVAQELGILNYHVWDTWSHAREQLFRAPLSEERKSEITDWFAAQAPQRAGTGPWFGIAARKNLLMVQVESLQAFVIGREINGLEVTPNLNRWRSQVVWFSSCTDQTANGRTSDCEFASQVSLIPQRSGAAAFRFAGNDFNGIAEILGGHGYETLSAVPYDSTFWNRRVTHPAYGFRRSLFEDAFEPGINVGWGLNDRDFLRQMADRLSSTPKPFCAFLITLSNHHPFADFPEELKELDLGTWEGTSFGNYLHAMHYFDRAFGEFLERLDEDGLLDETVIALWGDHAAGYEWNEEFASLAGYRLEEINWYLSESVPFMIRVPGASGLPGERTNRVGQIDFAPTLLALMGVDPAPLAFMGRNLLGEPGRSPVTHRYGSWFSDEVIYVTKGEGLEEGHCYERATLRFVPVEECRAGNDDALRRMKVSRDVVRWNLQSELARRLAERMNRSRPDERVRPGTKPRPASREP